MAKMSRRRIAAVAIGLGMFTLVSVGYLLYELVSLLAQLLSLPGAICTLLFLFAVLARKTLEALVFPGALTLWRRSIESRFCEEMSTQLLMRVKDLRNILEILLEGSTHSRSFLLPQRTASYARKAITGLIHTFSQLRDSQELTSHQSHLLSHLESLQTSLRNIHIPTADSDAQPSLWDWLDYIDGPQVVLTEYQNTQEAHGAVEICKELEKVLYKSCGRVSVWKRWKRWMRDTTLGHISQLRIELITAYQGRQMWVESYDHTKLDCLWIPCQSNSDEAPTVLFCNPNGGFYEFASYQSEWLDFYTHSGVNIVLWNYRGYGRTKGRPTPTLIKRDGLAVAEHLKRVLGVDRLAVHGESMGGMVAAYVARHTSVEFLFADRTFGSLDAVAKFGFGEVAYYLYRLLSCWNSDTVDDYIHAQCYKVISSDPSDSMISDFASLKTAVALRLLNPSNPVLTFTPHILTTLETTSFLSSLTNFTHIVYYFNKRDGERSPRSLGTLIQGLTPLSGQSNYQILGPDTDAVLEDEAMLATIYRLFGIVGELDAGGKALTAVCSPTRNTKKHSLNALQNWLITLDKWGSYSLAQGEISDSKQLAVQKCRMVIVNIDTICQENEHVVNPFLQNLLTYAKEIAHFLSKVLVYLESTYPETPAGRSTPSTDAERSLPKASEDFYKAGYLLPVACGHSGPFSAQEKLILELHLTRVQFHK